MTPMTQSPPTGELVALLTTNRSQLHGDWLDAMSMAAERLTTLERELEEARTERDAGRNVYLTLQQSMAVIVGKLTAAQAEVERLKLELQQAEAYWGGRAKP